MISRSCRSRSPLARVMFPEMTCRALFFPPPRSGTVLMPFTVDDEFHVFARERCLPPCALSFLMLAGSWSARESRSGFVPNSMLADFSDDFAQAERTLCSAGILKRVKAGVRIVEGHGVTVVNAKDVHRDSQRQEAEAEERRATWRGKKQRQREVRKAGQRERIAAGVPVMSPGTNADVPPENPGNGGKPQVSGRDVPGDITGTSPGTAKTTSSDYQDPSQSVGVKSIGVDLSNARPREVPSPETLALVVAGISKKRKRATTEAEACRAIAEWDRRAEEAGKVVHDPAKFYPTCIRREGDLEAIIAPPPPAPRPEWLELGQAPDPAPGAHLFEPSADPYDTACSRPGCGLPEKNTRVHLPEAKTG